MVSRSNLSTEQLTVYPADGSPSVANLDTYKVPAQPDMPAIQVLLVDGIDAVGPFGAKAVGEVPVAPDRRGDRQRRL
mgnify:CR=1 FL=1